MADFTLSCVDVHYERILIENAEGQPLTSTDTLVASSSDDTAITCTLGVMPSGAFAGAPARVLTPLRQPRTGDVAVVCTVHDTSNPGVSSWVDNVTLGPDSVPTQLVGDPSNVVLVTQPLPPA
jgi:hypothetical protein